MVPSISITDLKKLLNCIWLIDIRSSDDYCMGYIPGAINMPFEKLLGSLKSNLDKKYTYYIYCDTGKVSKKVVQILINEGYKAVNIDGGYEGWVQENKIL